MLALYKFTVYHQHEVVESYKYKNMEICGKVYEVVDVLIGVSGCEQNGICCVLSCRDGKGNLYIIIT